MWIKIRWSHPKWKYQKAFLNRQTVVSLKWNNREAEKAILFLRNITAGIGYIYGRCLRRKIFRMEKHFLCLVLPFVLFLLGHQVEGRHGGRLGHGKGKTSGNLGIVNKELASAGGQQGGAMIAEKGTRREKRQVLKSRGQKTNEKKRKRNRRPARRPKTGKNRQRSKKHGKGKGKGQKKKRQQKKKQKKEKKQKKDKKKGKRTDYERKHNRTCSVDASCIVNAQTVLLYEKNQVI